MRLAALMFILAVLMAFLAAFKFSLAALKATVLNASLGPMRGLWDRVAAARHPERRGASSATLQALL